MNQEEPGASLRVRCTSKSRSPRTATCDLAPVLGCGPPYSRIPL